MAYPNNQNTSWNDEFFANMVTAAEFAAYENSIARQMVKVFDVPMNAGKNVQVPIWGSMSAEIITDESDATLSQTTSTSANIALTEHVVYRQVTDMLRDSAYGDVVSDLGFNAGRAIAESIDTQVFSKFASFTGGGGLGSTSTEITVDLLLRAGAALRAAKLTGPFFAVVHPNCAYNIKKQLTYSAQTNIPALSQVGDGVLSSFYIGGVAGIQVYESALVAADGTGGATAYVNGVFAPSALGHAMRGGIDMNTLYLPKSRATDMVMKAVAGAAVLQAGHGVKIIAEGTAS